jgi:hypothetical protein
MALQVNDVLPRHGLNAHVLAYVKDEGANFSTVTFALTSVVSCEVMGFLFCFVGVFWGHTMSKCCQYAIDDSKVCNGLILISIKEA